VDYNYKGLLYSIYTLKLKDEEINIKYSEYKDCLKKIIKTKNVYVNILTIKDKYNYYNHIFLFTYI
jgi:hypothetical protein